MEQERTKKEDSLWAMLGDFYNKKMIPFIILLWIWAIFVIAVGVWAGIEFANSEQVKTQILFATILICCFQFMAMIKTFAWQMIHRNNIKREIKRLKDSITELSETVKNK